MTKSTKIWITVGVLAALIIGYGLGRMMTWRNMWHGMGYGGGYSQMMERGSWRGGGGDWQHGRGMKMGERGLDRVLNAIEATPEQREKIKALAAQSFANMPNMRSEMRNNGRELMDILSQDTIDKEKLNARRLAMLDKVKTMSEEKQETFLKIAAELTPAQRQKLKLLAEMRMSRFN